MAYSVPLILYVIIQLAALLLLLVGTPIEMFRVMVPNGDPICITLWGSPYTCRSSDYLLYIEMLYGTCPSRVSRFRVAQAFVIISIAVYLAAFTAGLTLLFCCSFLRVVCLALNVVGAGTLCVVWVAMVVTYNKVDGPQCSRLKDRGTLGVGLILLVVAWILDIINIIFLLIPSQVRESVESVNSKEYT
ncbi:uncharacterized protein, partial [Leishmania mexicana MHOM/GT/2001/U1103]